MNISEHAQKKGGEQKSRQKHNRKIVCLYPLLEKKKKSQKTIAV